MPKSAKYWELETPVERRFGNFVVKVYKEAKKIQLFTWIESTNYTGYSKGVTIDADKMDITDIVDLKEFLMTSLTACMSVKA
jgi:hypothetical protein